MTDGIPDDFPRRTSRASLSGAAPKLSVRLTPDGMYTDAVPDDEYKLAYENAEALAQYLKTYVERKERESDKLGLARDDLLKRIDKAVDEKFKSGEWDIEPAERAWVMKRLATLLQ